MRVQDRSIHRRRARRFAPDGPLAVPSGSPPTTTDTQDHLPSDTDSIRCHSGDSDIVGRTMPSSLPSLSSDAASVSSSTSSLSLDTGWASGLANHILEDDGTGALVVPPTALPPPAPSPPPPRPLSISSSPAAIATQSQYQTQTQTPRRYICLFPVLDCHDTFDDPDQWKTHVLSHFRTHAPPPTARCPLCADECFEDEDGERAWDRLLAHVDAAHYRRGQSLAGCRPDHALMQYLFQRRIISDAQFKGMQMPPPPNSPAYHRSQEPLRRNIGSADEPYCAPYSRRREERMRGQRRGVSVI